MSDQTPEAIIAEHAERYPAQRWIAPDGVYMRCRCGDSMHPVDHAAHVVFRLRDAGHTIVQVPAPTMGQGITSEWWPETDESPWSITEWNGQPRIDFDAQDDKPMRYNTALQVSPTGDFWPFISLDVKHARLLAVQLLAAAALAASPTAQEGGAS